MKAPQLVVRYAPDDEYCGELFASVESQGYCGKAKAWFDKTHLQQNSISALRTYPLSPNYPAVIESGFGSKTEPGVLAQCHLRIAVRTYSSQGLLIVHTDLATECWNTPDQDRQQFVTARFLTEYALVDLFAQELNAVLDGQREFATLKGRLP